MRAWRLVNVVVLFSGSSRIRSPRRALLDMASDRHAWPSPGDAGQGRVLHPVMSMSDYPPRRTRGLHTLRRFRYSHHQDRTDALRSTVHEQDGHVRWTASAAGLVPSTQCISRYAHSTRRANDAGGGVGRTTLENKTSTTKSEGGRGRAGGALAIAPDLDRLEIAGLPIRPRIPVPGRGLPRTEYSVARVPGSHLV